MRAEVPRQRHVLVRLVSEKHLFRGSAARPTPYRYLGLGRGPAGLLRMRSTAHDEIPRGGKYKELPSERGQRRDELLVTRSSCERFANQGEGLSGI